MMSESHQLSLKRLSKFTLLTFSSLTSLSLLYSRSIKDHRDGGGQVTLSIAHCRKLVIAAVNGSAVGIGATMQLPCDIRIISSTAKIAFPFAKRGITTEACSAFYLPRLVGTSKALELVMTADTYKPDYPALLPLWREILPAEQVFPKSLELAKRLIKENSVVSMAIMKSLIYRAPDNPEETHLVDSQAIAATSAGDAVEGEFKLKQLPSNERDTSGHIEDLLTISPSSLPLMTTPDDRFFRISRCQVIHGKETGKFQRNYQGSREDAILPLVDANRD